MNERIRTRAMRSLHVVLTLPSDMANRLLMDVPLDQSVFLPRCTATPNSNLLKVYTARSLC